MLLSLVYKERLIGVGTLCKDLVSNVNLLKKSIAFTMKFLLGVMIFAKLLV